MKIFPLENHTEVWKFQNYTVKLKKRVQTTLFAEIYKNASHEELALTHITLNFISIFLYSIILQ